MIAVLTTETGPFGLVTVFATDSGGDFFGFESSPTFSLPAGTGPMFRQSGHEGIIATLELRIKK